MTTTRHSYPRANGSRFTIDVTIDVEALARDIAERMAMHGRKAMTIGGGAIRATVVDHP